MSGAWRVRATTRTSTATTFDLEPYFRRGAPEAGLWAGAEEGLWVLTRWADAPPGLPRCGCSTTQEWPKHLRLDGWPDPYGGAPVGVPNVVDGWPRVRAALLRRDTTGRFVRERWYSWKPDLALFRERYVLHLAECSAKLLVEEVYG